MKLITLILLIICKIITTEAQRNCLNPIVILNNTVPLIINLAKEGFGQGFSSGKKVIIVGIPTNQTNQFAINLANDGELFKTAQVAFHFNPRFNEEVVVRNSWKKRDGWGPEERSGDFPFEIGQIFVLEFDSNSFRYPEINIYVNSKFFVLYRRLYLTEFFYGVSHLEITGAIKLISITLCGNPPPQPPPICEEPIVFPNVNVPVNYDFVKIGFGIGFLPKKKITIIGTPIINEYGGTKDFVINMGENGVMEKNASILFSFNARFDNKTVVRNTWTKEKGWGYEERYGGFPFAVDQPFVLEIFTEHNDTINVNIKYKSFISFIRFDLTKVSQIEISRAIKVSSVIFCKKI